MMEAYIGTWTKIGLKLDYIEKLNRKMLEGKKIEILFKQLNMRNKK